MTIVQLGQPGRPWHFPPPFGAADAAAPFASHGATFVAAVIRFRGAGEAPHLALVDDAARDLSWQMQTRDSRRYHLLLRFREKKYSRLALKDQEIFIAAGNFSKGGGK